MTRHIGRMRACYHQVRKRYTLDTNNRPFGASPSIFYPLPIAVNKMPNYEPRSAAIPSKHTDDHLTTDCIMKVRPAEALEPKTL